MEGGPKRVTNSRALQTAKCANGLANAVVFTGGLTTHACEVIPTFSPTHSVIQSHLRYTDIHSDINTQNGRGVKGMPTQTFCQSDEQLCT